MIKEFSLADSKANDMLPLAENKSNKEIDTMLEKLEQRFCEVNMGG